MSSTTDLGSLVDAIEGKRNTSLLPEPSKRYLDWIKSIVQADVNTEEQKIEQHLSGWRLLNGKKLPFEENLYKQLITQQLGRQGKSEEGVNNHIKAIKLWRQKIKNCLKLLYLSMYFGAIKIQFLRLNIPNRL